MGNVGAFRFLWDQVIVVSLFGESWTERIEATEGTAIRLHCDGLERLPEILVPVERCVLYIEELTLHQIQKRRAYLELDYKVNLTVQGMNLLKVLVNFPLIR